MSKYKICPLCGTHNLPTIFECIECETDLTSVRAVDELSEQMNTGAKTVQTTGKMIRLCDCGAKNPPSARKCSECGEDISDIIPTPDKEETAVHYVLTSTDGKYAFELNESSVIIGRESVMKEYLSSKSYVSRNHAELSFSDGKLYIKNLSKANGTYVNNVKIDDEVHELHDGDAVSLGGCEINGKRQENAAYFLVRISSCI